jgi:hypothetical protein
MSETETQQKYLALLDWVSKGGGRRSYRHLLGRIPYSPKPFVTIRSIDTGSSASEVFGRWGMGYGAAFTELRPTQGCYVV